MFPTKALDPAASGYAFSIAEDPRLQRLFHEHRKLANRAKNYAYAHPGIIVLGEDPLVDHLAAGAGFGSTDLAMLRISVDGRSVTAICVPTRLWRDPEAKARLLQIKSDARDARTRCILVPQRWLKASVRGSIARSIARARGVSFTREHRDQVLAHLKSARISTILDAARAVSHHEDPGSVVLAMCAQGLVKVDRSSPLRGDTWIECGQ